MFERKIFVTKDNYEWFEKHQCLVNIKRIVGNYDLRNEVGNYDLGNKIRSYDVTITGLFAPYVARKMKRQSTAKKIIFS